MGKIFRTGVMLVCLLLGCIAYAEALAPITKIPLQETGHGDHTLEQTLLRCRQQMQDGPASSQLCLGEIEKILGYLSPKDHFSAVEKRRALSLIDELLSALTVASEHFFQQEKKRDVFLMATGNAFIAVLSNQILLLRQRIEEKETWNVTLEAGVGGVHFQNGSHRWLARTASSLQFDLGRNVDGELKLGLASPLMEDTGSVLIPPNEGDVVQLQRAWLGFKGLHRLYLQAGVFPSQDWTAPSESHYASLRGQLTLLKWRTGQIGVAAQHNRVDTYAPAAARPVGQPVEHNTSEAKWSQDLILRSWVLGTRAGSKLHWYSDPHHQLPSLSFGRFKYLDSPLADENTAYRIVQWDLEQTLEGGPWKIGYNMTGWRNLLVRPVPFGWAARTYALFRQNNWYVGTGFTRSVLPCGIVPPSQLSNRFVPGMSSTSIDALMGTQVTKQTSVLFEGYLTPIVRATEGAGGCSAGMRSEAKSQMPRALYLVSVQYLIDNASL